jgi:hypothetical protein
MVEGDSWGHSVESRLGALQQAQTSNAERIDEMREDFRTYRAEVSADMRAIRHDLTEIRRDHGAAREEMRTVKAAIDEARSKIEGFEQVISNQIALAVGGLRSDLIKAIKQEEPESSSPPARAFWTDPRFILGVLAASGWLGTGALGTGVVRSPLEPPAVSAPAPLSSEEVEALRNALRKLN